MRLPRDVCLVVCVLLPLVAHAQQATNLLGANLYGVCPTNVYQGVQASDAFSSIHYLGNGRVIAGKRSSSASNRFLLSTNYGSTWAVVGCPLSTGAHTYFVGQNGATVFSGTGDTGSACLMKSTDTGTTWNVALSSTDLNNLVGSGNALAVFGVVYLGSNRWAANVKSFDTPKKVIMSSDNGATWSVPAAQPGQSISAWARNMIHTGDNVMLWPSCTTATMYESTNQCASWFSVTVPGASLFQTLCDAGNGVYFCGDVRTTAQTAIALYRSLNKGLSWSRVTSVNLHRSTLTYWRDMLKVSNSLLASACCAEGTSNERYMKLFTSVDNGETWYSLGNPFGGPYGGMQAIYQMCATESNVVLAGCQPDSTILKWPMPSDASSIYCVSSLIPPLGLIKAGAGDLILNGSNSFSGSLTVSEGGVRVSGALGLGGDVFNEGEICVAGGTLAVSGTTTNNGRMLLVAGAALSATGFVVNNGVLDMMTGSQTLPAQFINSGALLDRGDIRIDVVDLNGQTVSVAAQSYPGHDYQLQERTVLNADSWQDCGQSQGGTGGVLTFPDPMAGATQGFYRIVISP